MWYRILRVARVLIRIPGEGEENWGGVTSFLWERRLGRSREFYFLQVFLPWHVLYLSICLFCFKYFSRKSFWVNMTALKQISCLCYSSLRFTASHRSSNLSGITATPNDVSNLCLPLMARKMSQIFGLLAIFTVRRKSPLFARASISISDVENSKDFCIKWNKKFRFVWNLAVRLNSNRNKNVMLSRSPMYN